MSSSLPRHVAIIMDGNGRWAKARGLPRIAGHKQGVETVRNLVRACAEKKVEVLTLFAFSSENWRRPRLEVKLLMQLFLAMLKREARRLHENKVRLRVIGDKTAFSPTLQKATTDAEKLTEKNTGLTLVIAANYGGRWDITQAARKLAELAVGGSLKPSEITEAHLNAHISLQDLPGPDLFIRTGGEERVSNYLLWQLAYTEFYFTDCLWPDFTTIEFDKALSSFAGRQRRFGRTGDQVAELQQ